MVIKVLHHRLRSIKVLLMHHLLINVLRMTIKSKKLFWPYMLRKLNFTFLYAFLNM